MTVLNEGFKVDLVPLYDEFMLPKNRIKRKYFQNNFAQSEKNRVKSKWLEKMNQLKKHVLFFDFLENHYVSNDEVSKQHLSVIKKSNFIKEKDKSTIPVEKASKDLYHIHHHHLKYQQYMNHHQNLLGGQEMGVGFHTL